MIFRLADKVELWLLSVGSYMEISEIVRNAKHLGTVLFVSVCPFFV